MSTKRPQQAPARGWIQCRIGDFQLETSWEIQPGRVLVLFGPSGSGKSSTLRAIAGLLNPVAGHVEIGEVITRTWIDKKYTAIVYEMFKHDALYRESGIWIDLDRDGKLDKEKEHFANGATLNMDGKDYTIRLNYP